MKDCKGKQKGRRHGRHNFWREWHEMHDQRLQEVSGSPEEKSESPRHSQRHGRRHGFGPQKRAQMWREFFHDYMGEYPEDHWAFGGRRFNPWRQGDDSFNPFVATLLSKGGGLLPLIVLNLLEEKARYGNEIMDEIGRSTDGKWVANPGAIYPLMTILEEQGLITGQWEDPRKRTVRIYELTERGRAELPRLRAIVKPKLVEAIEVLEKMVIEMDESEDDSAENDPK